MSQLTFQSGQDTIVRGQFMEHGILANTNESNFRPVSEQWYVPCLDIQATKPELTTYL